MNLPTRASVFLLLPLFLLLSLFLLFVPAASLASPAAASHWSIHEEAQPTNFSPADTPLCLEKEACDSYTLLVTNTGARATGEDTVVTDRLPDGVVVKKAFVLRHGGEGPESSCVAGAQVTCTIEESLPPGETLQVIIELTTQPGAAAELTNAVTVSGGATPAAALTQTTSVTDVQPSFGVLDFAFEVDAADGTQDTQAGDHPHSVTTSFEFPESLAADDATLNGYEVGEHPYGYSEAVKDIAVQLPLGLVGDPMAAPTCPQRLLAAGSEGESDCPADSRIGTASLNTGKRHFITSGGQQVSYIYNITPEHGYPAEFGLTYLGKEVFLYASVVPTPAGYALRIATPAVPGAGPLHDALLTFYGNPGQQNGGTPTAFFTNPENCTSGPETATIEADTWGNPGHWATAESTVYPNITGCDMLQFQPTLQLAPASTQVDEPSAYEVDLNVPSPGAPESPVLATPELKDATVTLPAGVAVSPGSADGLRGCAAAGAEGIDLPAEQLGADGQEHAEAGHCPAASQIATVEIATPLLAEPLQGRVYLAEPKCGGGGQPACTAASATDGSLFGLYLEAEGSGVVIKLPGTVSADPVTGQLTASFLQNPQLPFTDLRLKFTGGARAPLANPQTCGVFSASSDLSPWSAPQTPDATPSSLPFAITGCGASQPFSPSLSAGTTGTAAGAFSPLTVSFSRGDGQQDLFQVSVHTPPGLLGALSSVPLCQEPQAAQGTCSAASQIGTTTVAAGSGSHPLWIPEPGQPPAPVYLTGPYKGAPFGLSIVVPAVAGPFNLGNVIVRAAINIDPTTAALTVTSDPLPQIIDGVPLRLQTVNVTINRPSFTFNPTHCTPQTITATIAAAQGAVAQASNPFAATACKTLPFKPVFSASTAGKASKANGASLDVKVTSKGGPQAGGGEANIKSVKVDLPKQLPSRLTTLQKACTAAVFAANPANCPAASNVGTGIATTPILAHPLIGPAYLVSHGGAAFPDLEIVLQGEGITLVLDGNTSIKKGLTSSTFKAVPDAPIKTFELRLPTGKYSVLGANVPEKLKYNLCGQTLAMPTAITAQNGAVVKQTTKVSVGGCVKTKAKAKAKVKQKAEQASALRASHLTGSAKGRSGR